jgi:hypothetical protein
MKKLFKISMFLIIACSLIEIVYILHQNTVAIIVTVAILFPFLIIGIGASSFFCGIVQRYPLFYEQIGRLLLWAGFGISHLMSYGYLILFWTTHINLTEIPKIGNVNIFPHPSILFLGISIGFILHLKKMTLVKLITK